MVRAKFKVDSNDGATIAISPVYSGSDENKKFFSATPGGNVTLYCTNPDVAKYFEVGFEYYIDFTKSE